MRHLWGLKSLSRGQRANTGRLVAQIPAKLIPCQGGRIRCCSFYLEECKIYLTLSLLPDHVFWAEKEVAGGAGMRSFLHRFFLKLFTYVTADWCLFQYLFFKNHLLFYCQLCYICWDNSRPPRYAVPFSSAKKYEQVEQTKDIQVIIRVPNSFPDNTYS